MSDGHTYLVSGASGHLGRLVLDSLLQSGAGKIIATTRSPSALDAYRAKGVDVRAADFDRQEGLADAFRGATHMLLISTQAVGNRVAQHLAAFHAAREAGVRHIFYTSHAFPDVSVSVVAPEHAAMEKAILASGITYTILRNFLYSENVLLMLAEAIDAGALYGAAGEGQVAFISRQDCADAAAGAMMQASRRENMIYNVTGPRLYSYAEIARIASEILGVDIPYINLSPDDYLAHLLAKGLPRVHAEAFVSFDRANGLGDGDLVTDIARELTGRDPETLEHFLRGNLPEFDRSQTLAGLVKNHVTAL